MKLIGWAIALAAAGMTPAAAQAPAMTAAPTDSPATAAPAPAAPAAIVPGSVGHMIPTSGIGEPDGRMGLQTQVTPIGEEAAAFHDGPLLWLCAIISAFVLLLLLYTMVRYRRSANPNPSRNSHNTLIEVVWTLLPVLILVGIAIPSIRLLSHQYSPPPADVTIKVTGHQWYWSYNYPDNGVTFDSYMLKEANDPNRQSTQRARTDNDGPPMLAVDNRVVIPAGKIVKFLVTADDVIHSFAVPAFWIKQDANPGQVHETWVKVDRPGVYFGQCSELCGARHGYMPIAVEVVPQAQFDQWVAQQGGKMLGGAQVVQASAPAAAAASAASAPPTDGATVAATATNQPATAQN
ncbi:MAG: cytochrome c oxidase subunit II [Sphingomonas sp.]|nr:cytochrome c oxidase subunit II [Sphingomonas sp.]